MKKDRGISLITVLITVVVIIIISSVSIYNGTNLVKDAKNKDVQDKLRIICNAIFKDDNFLNFNADNMVELSSGDYQHMDLLKYYDDNYSVVIKKTESGDETKKDYIYDLQMIEKGTNKILGNYSNNYTVSMEKFNYNVSFNEEAGVNRPIVTSNMEAIMKDGIPVSDIYKDNWYSYKKTNTSFARVKSADGKIFVWIPRFGYNIQTFYNGRKSDNVPNTAISIAFLRGTSNYMANDEVMPRSYKVHPAFKKNGIEYSGIWIEEKENARLTSLNAVMENYTEYEAHLMTNYEYGAALYLMYALDSMEELSFTKDEYVAASTTDGIDLFVSSNNFVTEYEINASGEIDIREKYGDALYETPWGRTSSAYPTRNRPYIIRKFSSGLFDFTNSDGSDTAYYRRTIAIK